MKSINEKLLQEKMTEINRMNDELEKLKTKTIDTINKDTGDRSNTLKQMNNVTGFVEKFNFFDSIQRVTLNISSTLFSQLTPQFRNYNLTTASPKSKSPS